MISIETAFDSLLHESISIGASDIHLDLHDDIYIIFRRHKKQIQKRNDDKAIKLYEFLRYKSNFDLSRGSQGRLEAAKVQQCLISVKNLKIKLFSA